MPSDLEAITPGTPTPPEIRARRKSAGLTQAQAAALVHAGSYRTWQDWETGRNPMPMMAWELFQLKVAHFNAPERTGEHYISRKRH